jgi:tRNA(fMet)-specific endonuclease VapC
LLILDTDVLSILQAPESELRSRFAERVQELSQGHGDPVTTIVNFEEHIRGWLAPIAAATNPLKAVAPYAALLRVLSAYANLRVLPFDDEAAERLVELRRRHRRLGFMDLKIAAIALANDASLMTRNVRDFSQVPQLKVEAV